ncbi:MAG: hypothetical protein WBB65_14630 [Anaerolineales bacterium]
MADKLIYEERVYSGWTGALFLGFTILFLVLLIWRMSTGSRDILSAAFFFFFFFYSINYRTLIIRLTPESLNLKFGIFTWTIQVDNIENCRLDDLPILMRYGGAGIHFMLIRGRYRASFNFLEHPRVVIALKTKAGPVRDISFSTVHPNEVIQIVQNAITAGSAT